MIFNTHSEIKDAHAFLSPSGYSWLNYDEDKLSEVFKNMKAKEKGTELHEIACGMIRNGIRASKVKTTFNMYVNDAIAYDMTPEQLLVYSRNCFGTADAISFTKESRNSNRMILRIHDLKTGVTPASMKQLEIYAALFCNEYKQDPKDISMELRIYQFNEIAIENPDPEWIKEIIQIIGRHDAVLERLRNER